MEVVACCCSVLLQCDVAEMNHVTDELFHICTRGMDVVAYCCSALLQKMLLQCNVVEMNFVTDKPSHAYE